MRTFSGVRRCPLPQRPGISARRILRPSMFGKVMTTVLLVGIPRPLPFGNGLHPDAPDCNVNWPPFLIGQTAIEISAIPRRPIWTGLDPEPSSRNGGFGASENIANSQIPADRGARRAALFRRHNAGRRNRGRRVLGPVQPHDQVDRVIRCRQPVGFVGFTRRHVLFLNYCGSLSLVDARTKSAVNITCRMTTGHSSMPVDPLVKPR